MANRRTIGEKLREAREAKGWSQRRLAREVGLSHVFISEVENGGKPVPLARRDDFARAVGLPPDDLIELDILTLAVVASRLTAAGRCDRAVRLVREMAGGGA